MPLVKLNFSDLNGCRLIFMVPSLPTNMRYLAVTNYESGAYLCGDGDCLPFLVQMPSLAVELVAFDDGYFALNNTDDGISKYLSVDSSGYIRASSSTITSREKFAVFCEERDIANNRFYLYSATGKYVTMVSAVDEFGDTLYYAAATSNTPNTVLQLGTVMTQDRLFLKPNDPEFWTGTLTTEALYEKLLREGIL